MVENAINDVRALAISITMKQQNKIKFKIIRYNKLFLFEMLPINKIKILAEIAALVVPS